MLLVGPLSSAQSAKGLYDQNWTHTLYTAYQEAHDLTQVQAQTVSKPNDLLHLPLPFPLPFRPKRAPLVLILYNLSII